ncbi:MAG: Hpt domain-containing protein [Gammaproteobacteria bacterium]|nr:Hpt domain-containing protein [Gammaproteobacteria bacterium]
MTPQETSIKHSALGWVKKSIDDNLSEIKADLKLYLEQEDESLLQRVKEKLGLIQGVLVMIEQYGAAMLTEEMVALVDFIIEHRQEKGEQALEVILRAVLQLPDYLEHIQSGNRDIPIAILPLLNDIRAVRNQDLFSEKLLFLPDLSMHQEGAEAEAIDNQKNQGSKLLVKKLRPVYQLALLNIIRDENVEESLKRLEKVCETLEERSFSEGVARIWWIVGALIESVSRQQLELGVSIKNLLGKVDALFRVILIIGERGLLQRQPIELIKNFLYYIAQPECDGPKTQAIKTAYRLEQFLPSESARSEVLNNIAGPNQALLKTVAEAMKADIEAVKSTLEVYVNDDLSKVETLRELPQEMHIISDTLAMIGLGSQRQLIEAQIEVVKDILEGTKTADEEQLLSMAAELLQVEQALDQMQKRQPIRDEPPRSETDVSRDYELDSVLTAVVTATLDDIQKTKNAILDFIKDSSRGENIDLCIALMEESRGALLLMNEQRAVAVLDGLLSYLKGYDIVEFMESSRLDALSQVVVSLEYFLEALGEHRGDAGTILDFADAQLQKLLSGVHLRPGVDEEQELVVVDVGAEEPIVVTLEEADATQLPAEELEVPAAGTVREPGKVEGAAVAAALDTDAGPGARAKINEASRDNVSPASDRRVDAAAAMTEARQTGPANEAGSGVAPEGQPEPGATPAQQLPKVVPIEDELEVLKAGSDPDILEIYLEEADEEAQNIARLQQDWMLHPEDENALKNIRRAFHTIKGSGRLVGAMKIGEFAWDFEQLLNRVIDRSIPPGRQIIDAVGEAAAALPELVNELKTSQAPTSDIGYIRGLARVLAEFRAGQLLSGHARQAAEAESPDDRITGDDQTEWRGIGVATTTQTIGSENLSQALLEEIEPDTMRADPAEFEVTSYEPEQDDAARQAAAGRGNYDDTLLAEPPRISAAAKPLGRIEQATPTAADSAAAQADAEYTQAIDYAQTPAGQAEAEAARAQVSAPPEPEPRPTIKIETIGEDFLGEDFLDESDDEASLGPEKAPRSGDAFDEVAEDRVVEIVAETAEPDSGSEEFTMEPPEPDSGPEEIVMESLESEPDSGPEEITVEPLEPDAEEIVLEPLEPDAEEIVLESFEPEVEEIVMELPMEEAVGMTLGAVEIGGRQSDDSREEPAEDTEQEIPPDPFVGTTESRVPGEEAQTSEAAAQEQDEPTGLSFDPELLIIYQQEVEQHLGTVNSALDHAEQIRELIPGEEIYRALHTIHGASRTADIATIGELAGLMEKPLKSAISQKLALDHEIVALYREGQLAIQRMTEELVTTRQLPDIPEDLETSFRALAEDFEEHTVEIPDDEAEPTGEFIDTLTMMNETADEEQDNELLTIFVDEANELLEMSDNTLHEWAQQQVDESGAQDFSAVMELQRYLHTLKGGARMAEIKEISDLSHEMESVFIAVIDGRVDKNENLVEALRDSFDLLHRQVAEAQQGRAMSDSSGMVKLLRDLRLDGNDEAPVELGDRAIDVDSEDIDIVSENLPGEPLSATERPSQDVIRVRSDLLDNLVSSAGEVSIYRARMEQQVAGLGSYLGELGQTITRLKSQLRNLEAETDAQIHFSHRSETGKSEFDPLEMDRYTMIQELSRSLSESVNDLSSLQTMLGEQVKDSETLLLQQSRVNTDLQDGLIKSRMVKFSGLLSRLRRLVRQSSQELGKKAELVIAGEENEVDTKVLDRMVAPLEHIIRNALSHGIETPVERVKKGKPETGRIAINITRDGSEVVIRVSDDGAGVNIEKVRSRAVQLGLLDKSHHVTEADLVQYILEPGFSTADHVTQLSGRGVGMDVVDIEIKQLGGTLQIETNPQGTTFIARLPFTLSINQAILVRTGEETYAIPLMNIEGITRLDTPSMLEYYRQDSPEIEYAGQSFALHSLAKLVESGIPFRPASEGEKQSIILSRAGDVRVALHVDEIIGNREIVVKSLGKQLSQVKGLAGASILADGSVVLILDVNGLVRQSVANAVKITYRPGDGRQAKARDTVMVVDDSITMRRVASKLLERHNYDVVTAKDGVDALAQLQDHRPDVMLLDIEMPRMDGFELATHMQNEESYSRIPIIMITSRTGEKHRDRAFEIGVTNYMGKPYQEDELIQNIRSALAG